MTTIVKNLLMAVIGLVMTASLSSCNYNSLVEKQQTVDQA